MNPPLIMPLEYVILLHALVTIVMAYLIYRYFKMAYLANDVIKHSGAILALLKSIMEGKVDFDPFAGQHPTAKEPNHAVQERETEEIHLHEGGTGSEVGKEVHKTHKKG